jgi:hypothetical protein
MPEQSLTIGVTGRAGCRRLRRLRPLEGDGGISAVAMAFPSRDFRAYTNAQIDAEVKGPADSGRLARGSLALSISIALQGYSVRQGNPATSYVEIDRAMADVRL